ncbi:hypothetical protein ABW20_dc0108126 [Dactylellina cionopaga]|nr:hypothetical protein ABW20_dc0108126 [Dactylellina cionopaga]
MRLLGLALFGLTSTVLAGNYDGPWRNSKITGDDMVSAWIEPSGIINGWYQLDCSEVRDGSSPEQIKWQNPVGLADMDKTDLAPKKPNKGGKAPPAPTHDELKKRKPPKSKRRILGRDRIV